MSHDTDAGPGDADNADNNSADNNSAADNSADNSSGADDFTRLSSELDLDELAHLFRDNVELADRKYKLRTYKQCFVGSEACRWLVDAGIAGDLEQAALVGDLLLQRGEFHHVHREHSFKNEYLYYRFAEHEDHGRRARKQDGSAVSWFDFLGSGWREDSAESLLARLPAYDEDELAHMDKMHSHGVAPLDEHNARLLDHVHPREWHDPEPKAKYNMVVIGAGAGGLVTAAATAGVGGTVALIEAHLLGGDCLNVGCVPSKALLRCANAAQQARDAARFGVRIKGVAADQMSQHIEVDFPAVMERMRRLRADISRHDSATRFSQELGIDVFLGRARFTGKNTVEVNGQTLTFARACIATGGSPAIPAIPGLADAPVHTNFNLFNLTERPPRFGVIGSGAIGMEMAQAFQRLGSQVTVFARSQRILPREDEDAAGIVQASLERDGVRFVLGASYREVRHEPATGAGFPRITVVLESGEYEFDAVLVATGRKPNVEGLGLEQAGVAYDPVKGVTVNDKLQTSNGNIYAVGDVASRYQFTHMSDFMARIVVRNALFFGRDRFSALIVPWATYTDPEIAHVGLYERDLEERGIAFKTFTRAFESVDRAIVDSATEGFVRVHVRAGTDEILGATIVGAHAGDMISELTLAMQSETGLGRLASVIHPYPTAAEAIRQTGDLYNRTRLTPTIKRIFRGLLGLQRR